MEGSMLTQTNTTITNDLMISLINKNVIQTGTELLIARAGFDLSGNKTTPFKHTVEVIETKVIDEKGYCLARSIQDDAHFKIQARDIFEIDGMTPNRIADSFGLKTDGSSKTVGKKRGRKPKNRN